MLVKRMILKLICPRIIQAGPSGSFFSRITGFTSRLLQHALLVYILSVHWDATSGSRLAIPDTQMRHSLFRSWTRQTGDRERGSCSPIKGRKLVVQSYTTEVDTHNHAVVIADDLYKHASGSPVPQVHSTFWLCQLRSKQACRDGLHV